MSWIVVQFSETDEVEVLPHKWLIEEGLVSYPPISYTKSKLERAIKIQEEPDDNWQSFFVKLLSTKIYNNFSVASAKASKACITSDISEKEQYLPPKRQQKKKCLSSSEDDEDADKSDSLSGFPSHPKSQLRDGPTISTKNSNSQNLSAYSGTPTTKKNSRTENMLSESTLACSPLYRNSEKESDEFQRTVLTYLIKIQKMLRDNEKEIENLKLIVENNASMLNRTLMGEVYKKQNLDENHLDGMTQILEKIPIEDTTGFDEVNALLSSNVELFKDFVHFLVRLGGTDYKESIKRILQRLLTNLLMQQYSLHGHKGKKVFQSTKIFEALIEATQKVDTKCSTKDIELKVSSYLAKSTERIKISKKNKNATAAIEDGQIN